MATKPIAEEFKRWSFSPTAMDALTLLGNRRQLTQDQIAKQIGKEVTTVSRALSDLHNHGLIDNNSRPGSKGRTQKYYWTTPRGNRFLEFKGITFVDRPMIQTRAVEGPPNGVELKFQEPKKDEQPQEKTREAAEMAKGKRKERRPLFMTEDNIPVILPENPFASLTRAVKVVGVKDGGEIGRDPLEVDVAHPVLVRPQEKPEKAPEGVAESPAKPLGGEGKGETANPAVAGLYAQLELLQQQYEERVGPKEEAVAARRAEIEALVQVREARRDEAVAKLNEDCARDVEVIREPLILEEAELSEMRQKYDDQVDLLDRVKKVFEI